MVAGPFQLKYSTIVRFTKVFFGFGVIHNTQGSAWKVLDKKGKVFVQKAVCLIWCKPKTLQLKLKQMSLFCPVKGLNCLMFSPFYRFGHPGLQQNNIVASPVALTVSVNTCWVVASPHLITSATSASKLCGIFIPPEDLW